MLGAWEVLLLRASTTDWPLLSAKVNSLEREATVLGDSLLEWQYTHPALVLHGVAPYNATFVPGSAFQVYVTSYAVSCDFTRGLRSQIFRFFSRLTCGIYPKSLSWSF